MRLSHDVLVCLIFLLHQFLSDGNGTTDIEDHLETEIELIRPNSFTEYSFNLLSTRQSGFGTLTYNTSGVLSYGNVNWELFTLKYWYETRIPSRKCPIVPQGIATLCDWALIPVCLFTGPNPTVFPKTIYVHTYMLPHFIESTLNFMNPDVRFVLLTGGSDMTTPRSLDPRFHLLRGFENSLDGGPYYQRLLDDERLIHWFAENHDMLHPKLSTLPTGIPFQLTPPYNTPSPDDTSDHPDPKTIVEISKRPLKFILSDRIRTGSPIWADRVYAAERCDEMRKQNITTCFRPPTINSVEASVGTPHATFLEHLVSYPFIACVHGGGIDPSPKAWEALLLGTIPIIQHSVLDDAYSKFPVMFVHDWKEIFENPHVEELLATWLRKLAPYYQEGSSLRKRTLERLKASYWIDQAHHKYREYEEEQQLINGGNHEKTENSESKPEVKNEENKGTEVKEDSKKDTSSSTEHSEVKTDKDTEVKADKEPDIEPIVQVKSPNEKKTEVTGGKRTEVKFGGSSGTKSSSNGEKVEKDTKNTFGSVISSLFEGLYGDKR